MVNRILEGEQWEEVSLCHAFPTSLTPRGGISTLALATAEILLISVLLSELSCRPLLLPPTHTCSDFGITYSKDMFSEWWIHKSV